MRKWNKLLSLLLAMVMAFSMTAVALADEETGDAAEAAETGKIVILHTNDVHCQIEPSADEDGAATWATPPWPPTRPLWRPSTARRT